MKKLALMVASVALAGLAAPLLAQQQQPGQEPQSQRQQEEVREIDADRDGRVTRQEYMQYYENKWQEIDRNGTGSITVTELERMQREKEAGKGMYNRDDWRRDRNERPRQ